jgi:tRNA uridine 5-carbamoylmethylation protein Kti12
MLIFNDVLVASKNNNILDVKASLIRKKENSNDEVIPVDFQLNTKSGQITNPEITSKDGELKIAIARIEPSKQEFVFKINEKKDFFTQVAQCHVTCLSDTEQTERVFWCSFHPFQKSFP